MRSTVLDDGLLQTEGELSITTIQEENPLKKILSNAKANASWGM